MPKDEFDFEDPMELSGVTLPTEEDTSEAMCECFIEEFMHMGYDPQQLLALFRNPNYLGPNLVLQNRGEPFVRDRIAEVFRMWGRPVTWRGVCSSRREEAQASFVAAAPAENQSLPTSAATTKFDPSFTDPMGAAVPKLNL
jgi:hypothetical protein